MRKLGMLVVALVWSTACWANVSYELTDKGDVVAQELDAGQAAVMVNQPSYQLAMNERSVASDLDTSKKIMGDEQQNREIIGARADEQSPRASRPVSFEVGYEGYNHDRLLKDPDGDVKYKGFQSGVFASIAWTPQAGGFLPNFFKIEGRWSAGRDKYTEDGDTYTGIKDTAYEVRGLVGKKLSFENNMAVTPYVGAGVREINDGYPSVEGFSGFDRETTYVYVPVGVDIQLVNNEAWQVALNVEYDQLVSGNHVDHLEQVNVVDGPNLGLRRTTYDLETGFGVRGSLRVSKVLTPNTSFFVEPFIRYWKVDASNEKVIAVLDGEPQFNREPRNETKEIGVRTGFMF